MGIFVAGVFALGALVPVWIGIAGLAKGEIALNADPELTGRVAVAVSILSLLIGIGWIAIMVWFVLYGSRI